MSESGILFEDGGSYIMREDGGLNVYRLARFDSAYHDNADGMSIAKARVLYLSGKRGKDCLS